MSRGAVTVVTMPTVVETAGTAAVPVVPLWPTQVYQRLVGFVHKAHNNLNTREIKMECLVQY